MPSEPALPVALLRLMDGLFDAFERGWQAEPLSSWAAWCRRCPFSARRGAGE